MNPSRITELKVGLFTLVGLAVLIYGIMWGKQLSMNTAAQTVNIHFPHSSGLIEGDAVTIDGLKQGRVQHVDLDNSGGVLVSVNLDRKVPLHSDASAVIVMLELMGGKKIDINPGSAPAMLDDHAVIQGSTSMDIPGAVGKLGDLSTDITRVLFRLDTALASINVLLTDKELLASVKHAIITLDATAQMVKSFIARNEGDVEATIKNARTLVTDVRDFFQTNRPEFERLIKNADKTVVSVNATVMHADSAVTSLNNILDEIKKGDGAAHKLIYDKEFAAHIDSTITHAHNLIDFILDHGVNVNLRLGTRP